MFYRIKQFIKAMTATVSDTDKEWIKMYLSPEEESIFLKLKRYEQRHCIDVALWLSKKTNENAEMIRLGLLHDVGKSQYPLNPFEKSIMVVLDRLSRGRVKQFGKLKMVKCYYNHPQSGYEMLKASGTYDEAFLEIIKTHHIKGDSDRLKLLQEADDLL